MIFYCFLNLLANISTNNLDVLFIICQINSYSALISAVLCTKVVTYPQVIHICPLKLHKKPIFIDKKTPGI